MVRVKLAHLTGLSPETSSPSRKQFPPHPRSLTRVNRRQYRHKAAYASAQSKLYNAFGDARQNNRPTFAFAWSTPLRKVQ